MTKFIEVIITDSLIAGDTGFKFNGLNTVTQEDVDNFIKETCIMTIGMKTTFVQVTLLNEFTLEDTSSCVDPNNYNEEVGAKICLARIKNKIWFLLGFLLQSALNGFSEAK